MYLDIHYFIYFSEVIIKDKIELYYIIYALLLLYLLFYYNKSMKQEP